MKYGLLIVYVLTAGVVSGQSKITAIRAGKLIDVVNGQVLNNQVILVDSNILIAHLRGVTAARDWLLGARRRQPLAISAVTITEITGGMQSAERRETWGLLARLRVEPVTEAIAREAGQFMRTFRASHGGIGTVDCLIAATAAVNGYEIATLNVRHFPMFPGLTAPFEIG